jgi:hypothetical protein
MPFLLFTIILRDNTNLSLYSCFLNNEKWCYSLLQAILTTSFLTTDKTAEKRTFYILFMLDFKHENANTTIVITSSL